MRHYLFWIMQDKMAIRTTWSIFFGTVLDEYVRCLIESIAYTRTWLVLLFRHTFYTRNKCPKRKKIRLVYGNFCTFLFFCFRSHFLSLSLSRRLPLSALTVLIMKHWHRTQFASESFALFSPFAQMHTQSIIMYTPCRVIVIQPSTQHAYTNNNNTKMFDWSWWIFFCSGVAVLLFPNGLFRRFFLLCWLLLLVSIFNFHDVVIALVCFTVCLQRWIS